MKTKSLILGIETSGILCSVAWLEADQVLLELSVRRKNAHATLLPKLIQDGFSKLNRSIDDLSLVCIGSGPGSFTGLRIGMAYAKGLCFGRNIPLIPVTNFEILAYNWDERKMPLFVLIQARGNSYYSGIFNNSKRQLDKMYLSDIGQLRENYFEKGHIIVHEEILPGIITERLKNSIYIEQCEYSTVALCKIAAEKNLQKNSIVFEEIEPVYIQPFAGVL